MCSRGYIWFNCVTMMDCDVVMARGCGGGAGRFKPPFVNEPIKIYFTRHRNIKDVRCNISC